MRFLISQNAAPDEGGTLSLDVATGSAAGGTVVTVTASAGGLVPGISGTLGGVDVGTITWIDSHHVSFVTPINSSGAKTLILSNPDGQTATKANAFTYLLTVDSLDVTTGSVAGTGTVTLTGLGYQAGAPVVKFGTVSASGVVVLSDTQLTCTPPAHAAGTVAVSVTIGTSVATKSNAYTYSVKVTSATPDHGSAAGSVSITVAGWGFSAGVPAVTAGGTSCTSVVVNSDTSLTCSTPAHAAGASQDIVVTVNGDSGTGVGVFQFDTVVTSCTANTGSAAGGLNVVIAGAGFTGTPSVTFGGTAATNVVVNSLSELTCDTPEHAAGAVDIVVTSGGLAGTLSNGFTYNVVVSSVSASSGDDFSTQSVTINGAGFTQTPSAVTFGGVSAGSIARVSDTQVTCTVPAKVVSSGSSVAVDVVVTVNGHSGTGTNAYTYKLTPWSLSPDLWHRADLGVSLVGGNVTSWANQGTAAADSNTNFSDVGNSAFRPTFNATDADFNGGPSFSFTTNSNQLRTGTLAAPITTPQTYVVVGKKSSTATDGTVYLGLVATSNIWAYKNASDANLYLLDTASANVGAHGTFILIVTFDGAASTWMLNSTTSNTVNLGAGHTVNSLKCFAGNGGNNGSKGVETAVKAGAMPLADRQRLMVALGAKHGVAIS